MKDQISIAFKIIEQHAAIAKLDLQERLQSQEALKIVWGALNPPVPSEESLKEQPATTT